jgi:hypothetical protein
VALRINFFEEYPEQGALERASLVDFPSTVFLSASSVEEYQTHRDELLAHNPDIEPGYWPILDASYWISPFADTAELRALFDDLWSFADPVLLDLELPFLKPSLFVRNALSVAKNKELIRSFIAYSESDVHTAEYPPAPVLDCVWQAAGVSYSAESLGHQRYPMYYSSMIPEWLEDVVLNRTRQTVNADAAVGLGLGTIATGVMGDEPILSPDELREDLQTAEDMGVSTVTIFRLGGLDEKYVSVLRQFSE